MKTLQQTDIKVSVIIPVYNTEEYLSEAVNSIRNQTLQDLEIIIINDGSTDRSTQIIIELANEDKRIKVYAQKNSGQSVARNIGIKMASGKYLYFMDSDDILDCHALETCYLKCEENKLDFIFFDAEILNKENNFSLSLTYNRSESIKEIEVHKGADLLQTQLNRKDYTPSPCLNVIRREFINSHALSFYPGIIHEDQLFSALLYLNAQRVMYIKQKFFKRRLRESSVMTRLYSWNNVEGYLAVTNQLLRYKKSKADKKQKLIIDALLKQMLGGAVWNAQVLPMLQRLRLFILCHRVKYRRYLSSRTIATMLAKSIIA